MQEQIVRTDKHPKTKPDVRIILLYGCIALHQPEAEKCMTLQNSAQELPAV